MNPVVGVVGVVVDAEGPYWLLVPTSRKLIYYFYLSLGGFSP